KLQPAAQRPAKCGLESGCGDILVHIECRSSNLPERLQGNFRSSSWPPVNAERENRACAVAGRCIELPKLDPTAELRREFAGQRVLRSRQNLLEHLIRTLFYVQATAGHARSRL